MSRTSVHRLRCSVSPCLHAIELTMSQLFFCDKAERYLTRIAEVEGWQLEPVKCPQHREAA